MAELGALQADELDTVLVAADILLGLTRSAEGAVALHGGQAGGNSWTTRVLLAACLMEPAYGCTLCHFVFSLTMGI